MDWTWLIPLCPNWMQTQLGEEPGQQNAVLKPQSVVGTGFPVMDVATGPGSPWIWPPRVPRQSPSQQQVR